MSRARETVVLIFRKRPPRNGEATATMQNPPGSNVYITTAVVLSRGAAERCRMTSISSVRGLTTPF